MDRPDSIAVCRFDDDAARSRDEVIYVLQNKTKMSNVMKKSISACLVAASLVIGIWSMPDAKAGQTREMTDEDISNWREISSAYLTPDGQWLVYLIIPDEGFGETVAGEVVLVIRDTRDQTERRRSLGDNRFGPGGLTMSASGRWIAFRTASGSQKKDSEGNAPVGKVTAMEVVTGREIELPEAKSFSFVGEKGERILLQGEPDKSDGGLFTLRLQTLESGEAAVFEHVREFAFDKSATRLAWAGEHSVQIRELFPERNTVLASDSDATYHHLTWSEQGGALAVLREQKFERALLTFTGVKRDSLKKRVFEPRTWDGFPSSYEISQNPWQGPDVNERSHGILQWRGDEGGIFFGISSSDHRDAPEANVTKETVVPNLALWHWQDERLPLEKKSQNTYIQPSSFLCFVSLADGRFVRLADETLREIVPQTVGRFSLGFDERAYHSPSGDRDHASSPHAGYGNQHRDYYLVDLRTGSRTLVAKDLRILDFSASITPRLSPDGRFVFYQDDGNYFSYEIAAAKKRNLTAGLPTRFYEEVTQKNRWRMSAGSWPLACAFQGWVKDGDHLLVSDTHDIWSLSLSGAPALNLTGNGRRDDVVYGLTRLNELSPRADVSSDRVVDLQQQLYFSVEDAKTGKTGLACREPGRALEILHWEHAQVTYFKSDGAGVILARRQTAAVPADYYRVDGNWNLTARLTDVYPAARELREGPGSFYLSYTTARGDRLHAVLYTPFGYKRGQKYPTVVKIYEGLPAPFNFVGPQETPFRWLQHGYAVLEPAIRARFDEAGQAAVDAVTASVQAAVETGVVDRDHLALIGHSYGGYETNFVISQTNIFKAAASEAGLSNLWSDYGAVYSDGKPNSLTAENNQPYTSRPPWEDMDVFLRNSPLYYVVKIRTPLLLVHGDQDPAVPFSQAVELFNSLRRLGRPVVLLEYVGGNHVTVQWDPDVHQRELQFFDHFLKSAPAPPWWSAGISYYQGQAPVALGSGDGSVRLGSNSQH